MDQFKVIGSVRMSMKHTKRKKEMGKKIDPGRVQLGKKMDRLEEYTSLCNSCSLGTWWGYFAATLGLTFQTIIHNSSWGGEGDFLKHKNSSCWWRGLEIVVEVQTLFVDAIYADYVIFVFDES